MRKDLVTWVTRIMAILLCSEMTTAAHAGASLELVKDGVSQYEIVVQDTDLESVKLAASELQRVVRIATGAELPIRTTPGDKPYRLVVGDHPLAQQAGVNAQGLVHDASRLVVKDGNVYFIGLDDKRGTWLRYGNPRTWSAGTFNAVIYFLREYVGAQWYIPGPEGEEIPSLTTLTIPADLNKELTPRFAIRSMDAVFYRSEQGARRRFESGAYSQLYLPARTQEINLWGRHLRMGHAFEFEVSHAWFMFLPANGPNQWAPRGYGEEFPEFYALYKGQRQNFYRSGSHGGQLCLSNPEMLDVFAQNIINYAKKTGKRDFPLSENDGGGHCECDNCKAWDVPFDADGKPRIVDVTLRGGQGPAAGQSKPVLTDRFMRFVHEIATRVEKEIPGATFGFYAYYDGRQPPAKQKIHRRAIVSDVYNFLPYYFDQGGKLHDAMMSDLRGWREGNEGRVVISSYYTAYGHWSLPWSTGHALDALIKEMAKYPSSAGMRLVLGSGYAPPLLGQWGADMWVYSELMWDPSQSLEELESRFYRGAFGEQAGPLVQRYYQLIRESMRKEASSQPFAPERGEVRSASQLVYPAYSRVREECSQLIQQATQIVSQQPVRYQQRMDLVARGWKLAELTLDMIASIEKANKLSGAAAAEMEKKAHHYWQQRMSLATEPASLFAVDPRPMDHTDKHSTWGIQRIVEKYRQFSRFNEPSQVVDLSTPWRFSTDPQDVGLKEKWFDLNFDDRSWNSLRVNRAWELQGYDKYDGVAWYRRVLGGLPNVEGKRLVLYFGAVDGDADVYINGKHLGRHEGDVGDGDGWQTPFWFDITDFVNQSGENIIAVRVHDTAGHGGIYKNAEIIRVSPPVPQWSIPEN